MTCKPRMKFKPALDEGGHALLSYMDVAIVSLLYGMFPFFLLEWLNRNWKHQTEVLLWVCEIELYWENLVGLVNLPYFYSHRLVILTVRTKYKISNEILNLCVCVQGYMTQIQTCTQVQSHFYCCRSDCWIFNATFSRPKESGVPNVCFPWRFTSL